MFPTRNARLMFTLLFLLSLVSVPASATVPLVTTSVEIRALRNGKWAIRDQSPEQVLQLVTSIRYFLGVPFNLYGFMDGQIDPNMPINGTTLDNYLVEIKKAAGGQIIPYLNLDYYTNQNGRYPCADGTTGPACFWEVSSALLSLKAIATGSHTVMLESWETFNRCSANPNYCDPATIKSVLQQIRSNGWDGGIIANDIGPFFSDQGEASYVNVGVSFPKASPWMTPDPAVLAQALGETYLSGVFVSIDTQAQFCPKQGAMDQFLANLNADQKALSLTELARNQASGHYIFVYPLEMFADNPATQSCDNNNGDPGYWDATTFLQSDNQPFLNLIIGLMQQYNRTGRQRFPPLRGSVEGTTVNIYSSSISH